MYDGLFIVIIFYMVIYCMYTFHLTLHIIMLFNRALLLSLVQLVSMLFKCCFMFVHVQYSSECSNH